jgi:ParB family chromosome partitioning protein
MPAGGYKNPSSSNDIPENQTVSEGAHSDQPINSEQAPQNYPSQSGAVVYPPSSAQGFGNSSSQRFAEAEIKPVEIADPRQYASSQGGGSPDTSFIPQPASPQIRQVEWPVETASVPSQGFGDPSHQRLAEAEANPVPAYSPLERQEANTTGHHMNENISREVTRPSQSLTPEPNYPIQSAETHSPSDPSRYNESEDYSRGTASVFQIEVEKIFPNPHQPRRHFDEGALNELANSIREFGIIQPVVVTKVLKETENGTDVVYQLIAGERRLMAARKVGLRTVPAIIKRVGLDREKLELAIIENVQREDLNPLEAARSFARLQDEFGLTQREIAIRMGKSRETIANTLRLLNLPSEIQQALEDGKINESHARLLLQIDDIGRQKAMFESILHSKPSVRELKATIRSGKPFARGAGYLNPELMSLQSRLEESLGTKTQIDDNGGKGKITINYYSPEELSSLIAKLSGEEF